jgi:hypothetical protein
MTNTKSVDIQFSSFNILADEEVRQGLKEYSNWPTFPQLYIAGKLVGGLDIVKELVEVFRRTNKSERVLRGRGDVLTKHITARRAEGHGTGADKGNDTER